ncbi:hypothetical protein [Rubripirellula tenax]|nr:hypothetical protein [Rubripirellula tenax]
MKCDLNEAQADGVDADETIEMALESIPKFHAFNELRRAAKRGDAAASSELDRLTELAPDLLRSLFRVVESVKRMVIDELTCGDILLSQATRLEIDHRVAEIMDRSDGGMIQQMRAEIAAIAWLDALRCSVLAARSYQRAGDANHFRSLAERATRRFQRSVQDL